MYRCISIDPPWPERGGGKIKRGADRHYPLMSIPQIIATVLRASVWRPDPKGCHVWVWATNNYLPHALECMRAWGVRYITMGTWAKATPGYTGVHDTSFVPQRPGLGQYLRGQTEQLLLGVIGHLAVEAAGQTLILAPRGRHSEKPEVAYELIEKVSPGPRLEMFARAPREGWDVWGNQV
jgi:N6-adenosine-specific RNA methylase IME4